MNDGAINGQESMRMLNIDTSIWQTTIPLGERLLLMIPHDYWTAEWTQQQQKSLNNQHSKLRTTVIANKTNATKAFITYSYAKSDFGATAKSYAKNGKFQKLQYKVDDSVSLIKSAYECSKKAKLSSTT